MTGEPTCTYSTSCELQTQTIATLLPNLNWTCKWWLLNSNSHRHAGLVQQLLVQQLQVDKELQAQSGLTEIEAPASHQDASLPLHAAAHGCCYVYFLTNQSLLLVCHVLYASS